MGEQEARHMGSETTLAVIGAGPKAIAIAAKAAALRRIGLVTPRLVFIDKQGVAAHWTGAHGYTDGMQPLGTPPEKDIGYPYLAGSWEAAGLDVTREMLRYAWQSFLIVHGRYADWVDRGKPRPRHRQWAGYLRWVAERVGLEPLPAMVTSIDIAAGRWRIACMQSGGQDDGTPGHTTIEADGLVITGTGPPRTLPDQPDDHPRVMDGRTFWQRTEELAGLVCPVEVCVVGTGETAASIVVALTRLLKKGSSIEVVSPQGVLYSRGESFGENRLYSNPLPDWPRLAESHRREFLTRTDRGVFSVQAEDALNRAEGVRALAGRVTGLELCDGEVVVDIAYEQQRERVAYDYVVAAIGFDALWFEPLLTAAARDAIRAATGVADGAPLRTREFEQLGPDLAITELRPRLHLPMLAGVAQGPGFPNLSCLGLLSDRVRAPYAGERVPARLVATAAAEGG